MDSLEKNNKLNFRKFLAKTRILTMAIALVTIYGYGQEVPILNNARNQGTILVSGAILAHYTTYKFRDFKSTSFTTNLTPKAGYFIMDNLVVGLELGVITSTENKKDKLSGNFKITSTALSVGTFARYYLNNGFFAEGMAGVGTEKISNGFVRVGSEDPITNIFGFRAGIGYAIDLGAHVALEPTINYSWEKHKMKEAASNSKETLSSIFLGIGFTVFL